MEQTFQAGAVERKADDAWKKANAFAANRPERLNAPSYSMVIPPPNITGRLHMGHALNITLQDVLCRFERMRGKNVLWQPGVDHAGIATQMVVERQLAADKQPDRRSLGREKFLEKVWAWKADSGGAITEQLKRLGASCDWPRERFTMDAGLSRAVTKVFVQLYKEGLIYKDKRLVNWDPKLLTAISDLEVIQIETQGSLWFFNYPVCDRDGALSGQYITVATTRPETMLGDTAVAVHPNDERYHALHGQFVKLPLVGRIIPIVADAYSDPEKGTGAVKITPAHDFNDFEVGRRHHLPFITILDREAKITLVDNPEFRDGVVDNAELDATIAALEGLSREKARAAIIALMEAAGLVDKIEPYGLNVPTGDRSGAVIEPYLTDQWYVNAAVLAKPALDAVRRGKTSFIPENWRKTYYDWLENIQPWCISRQLWWGHQIPAWYAPWGAAYVAETEEEALAEALVDGLEKGVLQQEEAQRLASDPQAAAGFLARDEDVLDTWFSSALWPFSTLGWPDESPDLKRFYPTSVLVTGFDIIFFWVARMMMMGLHFMEDVPFRDVYIHALVRDEKGAKMSKSKGNVMDPLGMIDAYGADALRFTLAAMAAQGRDIKLSKTRVEGYRSFATKLWNSARFAEMNGCARVEGFDPTQTTLALNRWIIDELAGAAEAITLALETYRFNEAAQAIYRFIWNVYCDWYVELAKPVFQGADEAAKAETRATTAWVFDGVLKLLHPFMPFITEELWAIKGEQGPARASVLALAEWPKFSEALTCPEAEEEIGWLIDLISEVRSVRSEMNVPAAAQPPLILVKQDASAQALSEKWRPLVEKWNETIRRLARVSEIRFADAAPKKSAQIIIRGATVALALEGTIDIEAEKTRLTKEIAKLETEAQKISDRIADTDFVSRAPAEVIGANRERLDEMTDKITKLQSALAKLSG